MKKVVGIALAAALALVVLTVAVFSRRETVTPADETVAPSEARAIESRDAKGREKRAETPSPRPEQKVAEEAEASAEDAPAPLTEEEKAAAAEEEKVNAFDALTDKWMEPAKGGVSMTDVDQFVAHFKKVPKGRQDECLHRALNLVPDENVMLLAGILMDKSLDKECLETVFGDILNRDESVKEPILKMVFKDKTHPCWADTAWIMDVTGQK